MNVLILEAEDVTALATLNGASVERKLTPVALVDERLALNADLLGDCGPGQTWEEFAAFLQDLAATEVEASDFVETEIE